MNPWIDDVPIDDDWLLDLLVDNELSEEQRRRLLSHLDRQPDGWRRCALAFLESQSYGSDLGSFASEPEAQPAPMPPARRSRFLKPLAVAASLMLAFALGMVVRGGVPGREDAFTAGAGRVTGPSEPAPSGFDEERPGHTHPLHADQVPPPPDGSPSSVRFVGDDGTGGSAPDPQLPLIDAGYVGEGFAWQPPSVIPPEVVRALERTGHRIEQTRGHLVVPVEETIIVPVAQRVF